MLVPFLSVRRDHGAATNGGLPAISSNSAAPSDQMSERGTHVARGSAATAIPMPPFPNTLSTRYLPLITSPGAKGQGTVARIMLHEFQSPGGHPNNLARRVLWP